MRLLFNIIIIIIVLALILAAWGGFFARVEVDEVQNPTLHAVYVIHNGSYLKVGKSLKEVEKYLDGKGVPTEEIFGQYFHDPRITPTELQTAWVGYLVDEPLAVEEPFKMVTIEPRDNVHTLLRGCPAVTAWRAYPAMEDYMKLRKYEADTPPIEINRPASYGQMITDYYIEKK